MNVDYLFASLELWGGIFCFIGAIVVFVLKLRYQEIAAEMIGMLFFSALMMVSDLCAFSFSGHPGTLASYMVVLGNLMMFVLPYLDLLLYGSYLWKHTKRDFNTKGMLHALYGVSACAVILTVVSIFNNMYFYVDQWNVYHRGPDFWVSQLIGVGAFALIFMIIIYNRDYLGRIKFWSFIGYIFFPFIMHLVQSQFYTCVSTLNVGIEIAVLLIMMVMIMEQNRKVALQENKISEQEAELVRIERSVNEMQIRLVLSQIQPHFLYNALNAIYYLCEKDAKKAQVAINDFSDYLRGNMDALGGEMMIPVSKELQHIRSYLSLEKMRFDDELRIEFDVADVRFKVPSLSLQPIVENAVKHGLGKKINGGTLKIYTYNREEHHEIIILDDGVGFDPESKSEDVQRSHIGVENVRKRLATLCGGTLELESTPGKGTCAIVRIPKNERTEL